MSADHNISATLRALDPEQVGQMLIFDCRVVNVPTTENFIVGEALILHCMVNTVEIADTIFTFIWSSNNIVLRRTIRIERHDHYAISQLNTNDDGQEYVCEVIIDRLRRTNGSTTETVSDTIELTLNGKPFIKFTACTFCIKFNYHFLLYLCMQ